MKRNVKIVCVVLAMSLCFGGLTACGASAQKEEPVTSEASTQEITSEAGNEESVDNEETTTSEEPEEYEEVQGLKEGDAAPDFTADLVDGTQFKMSDHKDDVVILNFFASWCPPCMGEMPAFEMLKKDGYSNLSIICVDCMEDKGTVDALVKEEGFTFPIAYDVSGTIGSLYPTDGIPYTLVIKNGVIKYTFLGAQDAETQYAEYKKAIDECMK
ncbi:MAG: TlpA family protein disulfide reductase [Butyrivibrio sp.]|nr:TlpA family protein disulfide reductase [Butyrivibrio sp.]